MTYEEAKTANGFRDADVARLAKVSPATLSEWRKGKYLPNVKTLLRIAAVLNCTIDELVKE